MGNFFKAFRPSSMSKHSGALISSKLMASKFPSNLMIVSIAASVVGLGWMQTGTTYTSPRSLNKSDFPSITGNPALGPIFPYPKIEVPSVTIADSLEVFE